MRSKSLFQLPTTAKGHILLNEYQLSFILSFRQQTGHFNQFFSEGCCSRKGIGSKLEP